MKTKKCTGKNGCGKEKPLLEFSKHSGHMDGLQSQCKECVKKYDKEHYNKEETAKHNKQYRDNNKEKIAKLNKKYQDINKEEISKKKKERYKENREEIINKVQKYAEQNKEKISVYKIEWRDNNTEKIKKYQQNNKSRRNKLRRERYQIDIDYKIIEILRGRLTRALKNNWKSGRTISLLGCSIEELKQHLQSQFTEGMSWDNHSFYGWHIDHIKPCSKFDLSDPKQQELCFNYTNLQPLWMEDNLRKGNKY